MPKKKKVEVEASPLQEKPVEEEPFPVQETAVAKEVEATDTVKVKVVAGTLKWEGGTFEKDEVFECSAERALTFGNAVEILK